MTDLEIAQEQLEALLIEGVEFGGRSSDHITYAHKLVNLYSRVLMLLSATTSQAINESEFFFVRETAQMHINIAVAMRS